MFMPPAQPVPAHMGDFESGVGGGELAYFAFEPAESLVGAIFMAALKQHLHPHADSQERRFLAQYFFFQRRAHAGQGI